MNKEIVMQKRDLIFPPGRNAIYERDRYTPPIRSNDFLFVSSQVGSREDGSPEPDSKMNVRQALENLNAVLESAGASFDDVIDVTVYIVNTVSKFQKIWEVVPEYWGVAPYPKLTAVVVTWLNCFDFEIRL